MNPNMLLQLMQGMGDGKVPLDEMYNYQEMPQLPPPLDTLYMIRPMLPPREQRFIDILIKMHELQTLFAEMQNEI